MKREPHYFRGHHYYYGFPTSMRGSLIMATGLGELLGAVLTLPITGPGYIAKLARKLMTEPEIGASVRHLPPKIREEKIRRSLYELKRGNIIVCNRLGNGTIRVELTKKGEREFKELQFKHLAIHHSEDWDGRWRMVLFDIPEKKREPRDIFRNRLKQFNFFQIQKSVWVYPYRCEDEIRLLCAKYDIGDHVLLYTIVIENDRELRNYYKLPSGR